MLLCLLLGQSLWQPVAAEIACPLPENHPYDDIATVRYVHDGDTLHLQDGRKIRLIGINTPELARDRQAAEPFSAAAKNALKAFFKNDKQIFLLYGKEKQDHYKRTLAHVFSKNGSNIQAALLNQGLAYAITFPPNDRFTTCYQAQEKQARCSKTGLWNTSRPININRLKPEDTGFKLLSGKVSSIHSNNKGIWLNLENRLTVGIRPPNLPFFSIDNVYKMLKQDIVVRGWLNKSKRDTPFYLRIRHPSAVQRADTFYCH